MKWRALGFAALSTLILAGCPAENNRTVSGPQVLGSVVVPNVNSGTVFSFDLAAVDPATGLYYVTDRDNASIDVVNSANNTLVAQFTGGFAGCRTTAGLPVAGCLAPATATATSGPNGLDLVTGAGGQAQIYAGDANGVVVLNRATGALIKRVVINGLSCATPCVTPTLRSGASLSLLRADEGCFDATDGIYAIASPNENPPFVTFIDTANQNVIATAFFQSAGIEACVYDPVTARFYFNNDGSAANPRGEISGISATFINGLKGTESATWPGNLLAFPGGPPAGGGVNANPAGTTALTAAATVSQPLGNCDPTGLTLGPGTDIASMCRQGVRGELLTFQIYNRTTLGPANPALAVLNIGGGDQIVYEPSTDQYYLGDSRWTATGTSCGAGVAGCPLTPVLGVVNATSRTIAALAPSGNNSHSVSFINGKVYSPYTAPTATGGGTGFASPEGGIAYFTPR
jgi:hypothetical protein